MTSVIPHKTHNALFVHAVKVIVIAGKKIQQPLELSFADEFEYKTATWTVKDGAARIYTPFFF